MGGGTGRASDVNAKRRRASLGCDNGAPVRKADLHSSTLCLPSSFCATGVVFVDHPQLPRFPLRAPAGTTTYGKV